MQSESSLSLKNVLLYTVVLLVFGAGIRFIPDFRSHIYRVAPVLESVAPRIKKPPGVSPEKAHFQP